MADKPSYRFYLAGLVMAALLCGLFLALITAVDSGAGAAGILFLIFVVVMCWALFHQARQAPTCQECGRRFIVQPKKRIMPASCPHCGDEQLGRARANRRLKTIFWGLFGLLFLFLGVACVLIPGMGSGPPQIGGVIGGLIAAGLAMLTIFALCGVAIYRSVRENPKDRPCEACGSIIAVVVEEGPKLCPRCRLRHISVEKAKHEQRIGLAVMVLLLLIAAIFTALMLWPGDGPAPAGRSWFHFAWLVLQFMVMAIAAWFIMAFLLLYARLFRMRSERGAIAMARKAAGVEGETVRDGGFIVWYTGHEDPVPMIRRQIGAARRRAEALTGLAVVDVPLRVLVFHDRGAFLRFHMRYFPGTDLASLDGLNLLKFGRLCTLCTAAATCRIANAEQTMRSLAAHSLLESLWGPGPPAWLQAGFVLSAAASDALARLNRRMAASLSCGTTLSVEIFSLTPIDLFRLARGSKDPVKYQKVQQFYFQAWSIFEFLCDAPSSGRQPTKLGAFLADPRSKNRQEESLRLHFGRDFAALLDAWRQWVTIQEPGPHEPPPPGVREALLERVLPVIRDAGAARGNRILAIREWANAGYVLGADALIDRLRDPGEIPRDEVIWALRMVSGLAWGDEPDRWQAWWEGLPMEWEGPGEPGDPLPEGIEVAT